MGVPKFTGTKKIKIREPGDEWIEDDVDWDTLMILDINCPHIEWYFVEENHSASSWGNTGKYCSPSYHNFIEKVYVQIPRWECTKCGLNLSFDKNTEAYRDFMDFCKKNPQYTWPWKKKG